MDMGVVPSYGEIKAKKVPETGVFDKAKEKFIKLAEEKIAEGYFDGSFIHGSVAVGTPNCRSDFDGLISLRDGKPENYIAVQAISQTIRKETGGRVPLEIYSYPKADLKSGRHTIDRFFGQHLISPDRIIQSGNDPAEYIKFCDNDLSAKDILAAYLRSKKFRMIGALTDDELDTVSGGLQRMLELPNSIGRKTLQALGEVKQFDIPAVSGVDKPLIQKESRKLFNHYAIEQGFEKLIAVDVGYSQLLAEAIAGRIDEHEYKDIIRKLHATLPSAIEWLGQVQDKILPLFDTPTK